MSLSKVQAVYISNEDYPIALFKDYLDAEILARQYDLFNPQILEVNISIAGPMIDRSQRKCLE